MFFDIFMLVIILVFSLGVLLMGLVFYFFIWLSKILHLDILELAKADRDKIIFDSKVLDGFKQQMMLLKWRIARFIRNANNANTNSLPNDRTELLAQIIIDENSLINYKAGCLSIVRHQSISSIESGTENEWWVDKIRVNLSKELELKKEARQLYWIGIFLQCILSHEVLGEKNLVA